MLPRKLTLVHHFPLSSVTGVTVMLAEMLERIPSLDPDIEVSYLHYEGLADAGAIERDLDERHAGSCCVVAVNLHIEVLWELSAALARWCARRAIPLFNYVQDYWLHHRENMERLTGEWEVRLVGSSPFIIDSLRDHGFQAGHLPMGAQLPPVAPARASSSRRIASVGRLVPRKRFPDVVRAFCTAGLDKTAELHLTVLRSQVFGSEQDARQLRLIADEIERPGVRSEAIHLVMTPTVPPDYASLAVYVLASDYEGFSMTPFEAAYCGCPPIVSDIPPHRLMASELFGERAGDFLYPVRDTDALGERLRDELATGRRRRYLEEHRDRIREVVETRFSVRTTARAFVQLVRECGGGAP